MAQTKAGCDMMFALKQHGKHVTKVQTDNSQYSQVCRVSEAEEVWPEDLV